MARKIAAGAVLCCAVLSARRHQSSITPTSNVTHTFIAARCRGVLPALAATIPIVSTLLGAATGAPALTNSLTAPHCSVECIEYTQECGGS